MKKTSLKSVAFLSIITFVLVVFAACSIKSDNNNEIYDNGPFGFHNRANVCFVGNSITHMGFFHNNIFLYHATRFPKKHMSFYNCGVSGDVTDGVLSRMNEDILIKNPTHAVIMLGMNDVGRNWYSSPNTTDIDTLKKREELLNTYTTNMEKIINIFLDYGVKVILERPTIYDQTAVLPVENNYGVNDALGIYAQYCDTLAEKYNLPTVDYYTIMNKINSEQQKADSSYTLTNKADRIHAGETGHFVMSYEFLKSEKAPKFVSEIIINSTKNNAGESSNCEIKDIIKADNRITFSVRENALPFPVKAEQKEGANLVPFMDEFNVELLQVKGLDTNSKYQLKIDNVVIDRLTGRQLGTGINLAKYHNTPQYVQSLKVLEVLQTMWKSEEKLRSMKFIEYMDAFKKIERPENLEMVSAYMDSVFTADNYTDPYYKSQLDKYIENKPKEDTYKKDCARLIEEAYNLAQPVEHVFVLDIIE